MKNGMIAPRRAGMPAVMVTGLLTEMVIITVKVATDPVSTVKVETARNVLHLIDSDEIVHNVLTLEMLAPVPGSTVNVEIVHNVLTIVKVATVPVLIAKAEIVPIIVRELIVHNVLTTAKEATVLIIAKEVIGLTVLLLTVTVILIVKIGPGAIIRKKVATVQGSVVQTPITEVIPITVMEMTEDRVVRVLIPGITEARDLHALFAETVTATILMRNIARKNKLNIKSNL